MRPISSAVLVVILTTTLSRATVNDKQQEEHERAIRDSFNAAYTNRSDDLHEFFNRTFAPGGDASQVAKRFQEAWGTASQEVRHFVNETYWNISKIMQGQDNLGDAQEAIASLSGLEAVESRIFASESSSLGNSDVKSEAKGTLDTPWNYFKSVFGVTPEKPHITAGMVDTVQGGHSGVLLGVITMLAAVFLVFQATSNSESILNRKVRKQASAVQISQVPPGYVRIT